VNFYQFELAKNVDKNLIGLYNIINNNNINSVCLNKIKMESDEMRYVIKRFLISVLTIFIVFVITFILMHSVPGGPFLGEKTLPANIMHNLQVKYGLPRIEFDGHRFMIV
jgi:hypothetical protein